MVDGVFQRDGRVAGIFFVDFDEFLFVLRQLLCRQCFYRLKSRALAGAG
jgi:hypothetical protein